MFFTSRDTQEKRELAQIHSVMLIFEADAAFSNSAMKMAQNNYIQFLKCGFRLNDQKLQEAKDMSHLEMVSTFRKCSYSYKCTIAQTLSAALNSTSLSIQAKNKIMEIAVECDIPRNYFNSL